jgi:L-asparaginase/Glu-tRNA(Gln) amidotransferase subunit D
MYINKVYSIDPSRLIINTTPDQLPISCANVRVKSPTSVTDWNAIGMTIATSYDVYNSFVVVADSDTIFYLYEALKRSFTNLKKPIILTDVQSLEMSTIYSPPANSISVIRQNTVIKKVKYPRGKKGVITDYTPLNTSKRNTLVKVYPGIDGTQLPESDNLLLIGYESGAIPYTNQFLDRLRELITKGTNVVMLNRADPSLGEIPVCKGSIESCFVNLF